jgi:hypothetical protein
VRHFVRAFACFKDDRQCWFKGGNVVEEIRVGVRYGLARL